MPKELSPSDPCNNPKASDCAHEASKTLQTLGYKFHGCVGCDTCKRPIRAHELGKWASQYPEVQQCQAVGTYLVYQVRPKDNQGHVYVYHNGHYYGNGLFDWPKRSVQEGKGSITTVFYQLK